MQEASFAESALNFFR